MFFLLSFICSNEVCMSSWHFPKNPACTNLTEINENKLTHKTINSGFIPFSFQTSINDSQHSQILSEKHFIFFKAFDQSNRFHSERLLWKFFKKQVEGQQGNLLALICPRENQKPPFTPDGFWDHNLIEYRWKTHSTVRCSFSAL